MLPGSDAELGFWDMNLTGAIIFFPWYVVRDGSCIVWLDLDVVRLKLALDDAAVVVEVLSWLPFCVM